MFRYTYAEREIQREKNTYNQRNVCMRVRACVRACVRSCVCVCVCVCVPLCVCGGVPLLSFNWVEKWVCSVAYDADDERNL